MQRHLKNMYFLLWNDAHAFAIASAACEPDRCAHSPVAQLVEQAAVNRWVAGSSPARGANPQELSAHY